MPMFNDFLQELLLSNQWLLSNQLEGRAGTKFPFPCDTQTIVDLTQEQDDCHVFSSLQADIIKKQEELKAAIARLTAFTGTLVNSNVPAVVPAVVPTIAFNSNLPAVVPIATISAIGNVVARKQ